MGSFLFRLESCLHGFRRRGVVPARNELRPLPAVEWLEDRLAPAHDTLATAVPIVCSVGGQAQLDGRIVSVNDVEMYPFVLSAGERMHVSAHAETIGSPLDAVLRVFSAVGSQLAFNDDTGDSWDPDLTFEAAATATYFVGVSSFENFNYDPAVSGTGTEGGSVGPFTLELHRLPAGLYHDTLASAIPITLGPGDQVQVNDSLSSDNEVRIYSFHLDAGQRMVMGVEAESLGSSLDAGLRVFNAAGRQLEFNDDHGDSKDPRLTFAAQAAGEYYVGVSSYNNFTYNPLLPASAAAYGGESSGSYTLLLHRLPAGIAHDTFLSAVPVTLDATGQGEISSALTDVNDVLVYSLSLQAGQRLTVDVAAQSLGSSLDAGLRLFSANNITMISNDDSNGRDPAFRYDITASGTYYVGVSSYKNFDYNPQQPASGSGGQSKGPFTISFRDESSPSTESESPGGRGLNDTIATAEPIVGFTDLKGSLGQDDVDYYRLDVDTSGQFSVQVQPTANSQINPQVALLRQDGSLLIQSDDRAAGDLTAALSQYLLSGTFYLEVSPQMPSSAPADRRGYRLTTSFEPAFSPLQPLQMLAYAQDVQAGDFNEDGRPDLVTLDGGLDVLLQNADGTFTRSQYQYSTEELIQVKLGDVNHDGHLDALTADWYGQTISLYLGNGDGTFHPPWSWRLACSPPPWPWAI